MIEFLKNAFRRFEITFGVAISKRAKTADLSTVQNLFVVCVRGVDAPF